MRILGEVMFSVGSSVSKKGARHHRRYSISFDRVDFFGTADGVWSGSACLHAVDDAVVTQQGSNGREMRVYAPAEAAAVRLQVGV